MLYSRTLLFIYFIYSHPASLSHKYPEPLTFGELDLRSVWDPSLCLAASWINLFSAAKPWCLSIWLPMYGGKRTWFVYIRSVTEIIFLTLNCRDRYTWSSIVLLSISPFLIDCWVPLDTVHWSGSKGETVPSILHHFLFTDIPSHHASEIYSFPIALCWTPLLFLHLPDSPFFFLCLLREGNPSNKKWVKEK